MPCVEHPSAACTWTLDITVPEGHVAVASGQLLRKSVADMPKGAVNGASSWVTFHYAVALAVPAAAIGLATGAAATMVAM